MLINNVLSNAIPVISIYITLEGITMLLCIVGSIVYSERVPSYCSIMSKTAY